MINNLQFDFTVDKQKNKYAKQSHQQAVVYNEQIVAVSYFRRHKMVKLVADEHVPAKIHQHPNNMKNRCCEVISNYSEIDEK